MTIVHGNFEWDSTKNESNIKKHGFDFEDMLDVFKDPFFIEKHDKLHSTSDEERYIGIGMLNGRVIITTVYTEREKTRIISARYADSIERRFYYEQIRN